MKVAATEQNKKIGDFILDRIGNTPLIELRQVTVHLKNVKIVAKAEWFNPGGSVKDRAALNMVRTAIAEGKLTQDKTILDSSSACCQPGSCASASQQWHVWMKTSPSGCHSGSCGVPRRAPTSGK